MAQPGQGSNHDIEPVIQEEEERVHEHDHGDGDHHQSLQQQDTAFLYQLNLLIVLLPFFSSLSTEDYLNFGEGDKTSVEEIQPRACVSRPKTRRRETNELKFTRRRTPGIHAIKDFRHSRRM